jgi:hypothetical protein
MPHMGRLYRRNYGDTKIPKSKEYIIRAEKLRRVKTDHHTKIVGASEGEIQEIKQGLDTNVIKGQHEKESKHQLRRLGFLD